MTRSAAVIFLALVLAAACPAQTSLIRAASRFVPGVTWKPKSVVVADFTCEGRKQQAILGVNTKHPVVVVAIFVRGTNTKPVVFEFSKSPKYARLEAESLDYELDYDLPGFRRSTTCKGLVVSDDEIDPSHLYWNHDAKVFGRWSN
jgi:hypothetical protein